MDVTKPYKFIGFGAMEVTKSYKFIGFGAMGGEGDGGRFPFSLALSALRLLHPRFSV